MVLYPDCYKESAELLLKKSVKNMSEEECCAHLRFLSRYILKLFGSDEKQAFSLCRFGIEILRHWIFLVPLPQLLHDELSADVLLDFLFVMDICVFEDEKNKLSKLMFNPSEKLIRKLGEFDNITIYTK